MGTLKPVDVGKHLSVAELHPALSQCSIECECEHLIRRIVSRSRALVAVVVVIPACLRCDYRATRLHALDSKPCYSYMCLVSLDVAFAVAQ